MAEFVPKGFRPPEEAHVGAYVLRPLLPDYAVADMDAVNESIDLIHQTRGGSWPEEPVTLEENIEVLTFHRQLHLDNNGYCYSIFNAQTGACVGCWYAFPPNHPYNDVDQSSAPPDSDAIISFWVIPKEYRDGLYVDLFPFTENWMKEAWPFKHPYIVNREQPAA